MRISEDDAPLFLYRFDLAGERREPTKLTTMTEYANVISEAIREQYTIEIVDSLNVRVFRCWRGRCSWPRVMYGMTADLS